MPEYWDVTVTTVSTTLPLSRPNPFRSLTSKDTASSEHKEKLVESARTDWLQQRREASLPLLLGTRTQVRQCYGLLGYLERRRCRGDWGHEQDQLRDGEKVIRKS